jgi:micrococcal nuclease
MRAILPAAAVLCFAAWWASARVAADTLTGRVISIADGDTITVLDSTKVQHKVRLADIDAPEKSQDFGTKSREALAGKIQGRDVKIETQGTDRYKRTLGTVLLDGRNVNLEMVSEGCAWHYKKYSKSAQFADAENAARAAGLGLWTGKEPMPPWEFRQTEAERKAKPSQSAPRRAPPQLQPSDPRSMSGKVPSTRP